MRKYWSGSIVILQPEADLGAPITTEHHRFYQELDEIRHLPGNLILDLSGVKQMNHVGMSELSKLLKSFQEHQQSVVIAGASFAGSPYVLGFLSHNFQLFPTVEAALESFKQSPEAMRQ